MDDLTHLLLAARDGDRVALSSAVRVSQPDVWRLARHLVGPSEADDVTQDTFVRMWKALPAFRGESSGRTWLLSIARRACVDALRRSGRRRRLAARLEAEHPTQTVTIAAPDDGYVEELVASLDPGRRDAFVLTQVLGLSYAEAADVCGTPIGTIRSRVARARGDLVERVRASETG